MNQNDLLNDAIGLLSRLIATPSTSRDEGAAADLLFQQMEEWQLNPRREANNVWAVAPGYDPSRPTLLLNAHIDTVKPVASWTRDPYRPAIEDDRLYGLGSNDCGGGLVTLLQVFRNARHAALPPHADHAEDALPNLVFLASAEEEVSGRDGISRVLPLLPPISAAIVGEPTGMQPAVAEKGLMVIDGYADGKSGHAARNEGVNAIYEALDDLCFLRDYRFPNDSPLLGPTKMTVTVVEAGTQHNVIPDRLHFVLDVRTNEHYRNEELFRFLQSQMKKCRLEARSFRLGSSSIPLTHPLVARCTEMGLQPFGSPTLSDQALMPFPSLKLGPGQSSRSHSADEFICLSELSDALNTYTALLSGLSANS
jgi:acetylornithine deacetylase